MKPTGEFPKLFFLAAPNLIKSPTRTINRELNLPPPQYRAYHNVLRDFFFLLALQPIVGLHFAAI